MLFKKLLKRQEPIQVKVDQGSTATNAQTKKAAENTTHERRRFSRPLPLPEVVEHDWSVWTDLTQEKTKQKPD